MITAYTRNGQRIQGRVLGPATRPGYVLVQTKKGAVYAARPA